MKEETWAILGPLYEERWAETTHQVGRIVGDWAAEDVAHEAFLSIAKAVEQGKSADDAAAMLWPAAQRLALNYIRDEDWEESMELTAIADRLDSPALSIGDRMFGTALNDALEAMPEECRTAWVLTELRGLTARETGAMLGVDQSTVSRRSERARLYIVKELSE